jgi:hypothetical protein
MSERLIGIADQFRFITGDVHGDRPVELVASVMERTQYVTSGKGYNCKCHYIWSRDKKNAPAKDRGIAFGAKLPYQR